MTSINENQEQQLNTNRGFQFLALGIFILGACFFVFGTIWGHLNKKQNNLNIIETVNSENSQNSKIQSHNTEQLIKANADYDNEIYNPQTIHRGENQVLRIGVFGDSMADGLWAGLYREINGQANLYQFSKQATGLTNYEYFDTFEEAKKNIGQKPIDIAIIVVGTNDQMGISGRGKLTPFGSPNWDKAYAARVNELISLFIEKQIAVYWVGLPIMRDEKPQNSARQLGLIFAQSAAANKTSFIDTAKSTAGSDGKYSQRLQLPNESIARNLRAPDGIHFKMDGYRLMALPVIKAINRDLTVSGGTILSPKSLQIPANQSTEKK